MEIPDGRYRARGIEAALGKTSTGKEQVAVLFQLMDAEGNPTNTITWHGYFTEKAWERTVESLRNCGWEGDDISDLSGVDRNEVSLVIEAEEYQGAWTSKVKWVNAPGSGLALKDQLQPHEAQSFAQQMRGKILALNQSKPQQGQRRAPAQQSARAAPSQRSPEPPPAAYDDRYGPPADDDLPF